MPSILDEIPYSEFVANGVSTVFGYTFTVLQATDLVVYDNGIVVPSSNYSVSGIGVEGGGAVTFLVAPLSTHLILLSRELTLERDTDYQYNGPLREQVLDNDFNRLWQALQGQRAQIGGAIRAPYPEQVDELPPAAQRTGGYLLGFDTVTGAVKLVLAAAGTAIALALSLASAIGSSLVGFLGNGVGAITRTIQAKLREWPSITDYGCVADGNYATGAGTDNAAALQAFLNQLSTTGGGVAWVPGGLFGIGNSCFKLGSQITIPDGVSLRGAGKWSSIFFCPTAFANTGGLVRITGVTGNPTCVSGIGVIAQTGGSGGAGIVSVKNGVFLSDVWVNGFTANHGIRISNTDNFLSDFAAELCLDGVVVTEGSVNVQHGTVYECTQGVVIMNNASVEAGRVHVTGVRAIQCPQDGFVVSAGKQVTLTGCSAAHVNNGRFTGSFVTVDTSSDVIIDGFSGKIAGTPSTTCMGLKIVNSTGVEISNAEIIGAFDNISTSNSDVSIDGGRTRGAGRNGALLVGGTRVKVTGLESHSNALAGTGSGIDSRNTAASSVHSIVGCTSMQAGGGAQQYGIYTDLTDNAGNTGYTLIADNVCLFNATTDIRMGGATRNIKYSGNVATSVTDAAVVVASAATITVPQAVDVVFISGTTNITGVNAAGCARRTVVLIFQGILTITDGSNLKLNGNFVTSADDTITMYCDGTNWYELARSAN